MKKTALGLALCSLLLESAWGAPHKPSSAKTTSTKPQQRIVPGAYIIELKGDAVVSAVAKATPSQMRFVGNRDALFVQHKARVAREQAVVRASLQAKGAQIHHSVDLVMNAVMVKYAGARQDLESMPGVKTVYPVRRLQKNLDRATRLTQVNDVWNRIGGMTAAGAGMKIGILDEGIDIVHPGFKDAGFTAPAGYPKSDTDADLKFTNNKVIVARSYSNMISQQVDGSNDTDPTVQDHSGHGTALAMTAAGVTNTGPYGSITGVAPGAYLGIYRIWNTIDDTTTDAADIAAINDAVADGMDVINMSFGSIYASRFDQDPLVAAVESAYQAGVLVVVSAGNSGPYFTSLGSPATAPHAITVGASSNDRAFGPAVWAPYVGTLGGWDVSGGGGVYNSGDGAAPTDPLTAPAIDASTLGNALGCNAFDGSVNGKIVVVSRGSCTFTVKTTNAQNAGAAAILVVDTKANSDTGNLVVMAVSPATLPAQSIDYYSGRYLLQQLAYKPFNLTMSFNYCGDATYSTPCAFAVTPNLLTGFSSAGPGVDLGIKPEVVAPGENMSMATQSYDYSGDMYDSTGYIVADGTSFSSPFTAGVAALIKAARPGLTTDQYRSLIINSAQAVLDPNGNALNVQQGGAGLVNALNAYQSPLVASPTSIGLGISSDSPRFTSTVTLTNIGTADDTFNLSTASMDGVLQPALAKSAVTIGAGQSMDVAVQFNGSGLASGAYQGVVLASSATTGATIRIPYWLDVPSATPSDYVLFYSSTDSLRNKPLLDAFDFRLTDSAGAPITNVTPQVTVVSGGGSVTAVNSADAANAGVVWDTYGDIVQDIPGLWTVDVVLGPASGANVFRVTAGPVTFDVTVTACRAYSTFGSCLQ